MDDLQAIISEIGKLADTAEASRWALAEAVAVAYAEFKPYSRGLTAGLCARLRRSTDSIYGLRDGWELRNLLRVSETSIDVSHFSALSRLKDRYKLSNDDCIRWLDWVKDTDASVREMSQEIATAHTKDARKEFLRRLSRIINSLTVLYNDSESVNLSQNFRVLLRGALEALREVTGWGD